MDEHLGQKIGRALPGVAGEEVLPRSDEEQYRLLFEQNPNPMWVYDRETLRFLAVNDAAVEHYGYSRSQFLAMTVLQIRPAEDVGPLLADMTADASHGLWRHVTSAGSVIEVEVTGRDVRGFGGRDARLVLAHDVTEQRQAASAVLASESRYRDLFENASAPIATVDLQEEITEVNGAFASLLGYTAEEMIGTRIDSYMAPSEIGVAEQQLERKLQGEARLTRYEQQFLARNGSEITLEVETRLLERDGEPIGTQGICRDITAQKQAERELRELAEQNRHQATHDLLTGLPNRSRLREAISDAIADGGSGALLLMDLDRFKEINDTLGHHHGDLLLQELAGALRRRLRDTDTLARLGGDEFGILLPAGRESIEAACASTLERIEQLLQQPFLVEGLPLNAEASIGIARYPTDADSADQLLQHADIALYQAKQAGAGHAYYRAEHNRHDKGRLQLVGELRRALDQGELVLYYQPKLNLRNGSVERVEALLRWQHPTRGLLPPSEFIEPAEQTGLIHPLTRHVIQTALQQCRQWHERGTPLDVAVNLSMRNLSDPDFPGAVARLLDRFPLDPSSLLLEITESALTHDPRRAQTVLEQLRQLGVKLALDDFGRGYTSLSFLSDLPLQHIKIDRSFITDLAHNSKHTAITRAIINLAHDLGLEVVAEGVETAAANSILEQLGCDLVQGYYYTPPLPPDELDAWLRQRRRIAAVA